MSDANRGRERLLLPATMTAIMLLVLLGLGTWQVKRMFWKEQLLAGIARAETAAPVPLGSDPPPFTRVIASGTFIQGHAALYGADVRRMRTGVEMGARLIEPLRTASGAILLVDRGWVPMNRDRPVDPPSGPVSLTGYVHEGDTSHWWSAGDEMVTRRFYTLDPGKIGAAVGMPAVLPFVLVVLAPPGTPEGVIERLPDPARHLPRPPNNHLSYAITWYGLAMVLLVIFVVWARRT